MKDYKELLQKVKEACKSSESCDEREKLEVECKNVLREYLKEHPDCLYESREEWVSKMTPEQKKKYYKSLESMATTEIMMEIMYPLNRKEIEKLGN